MTRIHKVLSTLKWGEDARNRLEALFSPAHIVHCPPHDDAGIRSALVDADAALIAGDVDARYLEAPRLKWVHSDKAGMEHSARAAVFERGLVVTSSAGRSAPALAEHVLFFMLSLAYRSAALHCAQQAHQWGFPRQGTLRALHGRTVGIVGLGHTAWALLPLFNALNMNTMVYRRRAGPVEGVGELLSRDNGDEPARLLARSDYVVLACSLNSGTRHFMNEEAFRRMKPGACLINVGRGELVDEPALIKALEIGRIAGAGLDTFSTEPLPPDHPLWETPNVLITPHFTPPLADRTERSLAIIADNKRRLEAGEPLRNRLSPDDIYHP